MFVESFQGQYKDGTNSTRDFRMVSASFLILRILIVASFLDHHYLKLNSLGQTLLLASVSSFYAIIRPYKSNFMCTCDILILLLLEVLSVLASTPITRSYLRYVLLTMLLLGVPHMVLILYICYVLAKKAGITHCLKRKYEILKRRIHASGVGTDAEAESDTDSLPDRLINPQRYEPALPTTEHTEDSRRLTPVYTYGSIS